MEHLLVDSPGEQPFPRARINEPLPFWGYADQIPCPLGLFCKDYFLAVSKGIVKVEVANLK
jgi:hypothetical protein